MNFLYPIIGLLSNSFIRGGGLEPIIGRNLPGRPVNAAIYGICFAIASHVWWHSVPAFGLMLLGSAPGWRQYLSALWGDGKLNNRSVAWGWGKMTLRGMYWGACLSPLGFLSGGWLFVFLTLFAGLLMAPCYWIPQQIKFQGNNWINHWSACEMLFGFVLWFSLTVV